MIYIFDKTQAIIKVLTNDDFTAAHLNFKINTATTFEFSLPASKALPSDSKYVATPHPLNDSKFIMLRLTERVDNTETIDYSAYELAYQELATDGYIEDKRPQNQSALNLMKIALDGTNWELNNVNVSGTATTNFYYVDHLSAISNVVDLLGGEIVFYIEIQGNAISGRYMDYLARQGADTSKVFASGSNLLTVERQSDTSGIYTAILPRGKGEEIDNGDAGTPDGYGRRINVSDVEWKKSSGNPLDKPKGSIVLLDPDATAEWGQINGNARLLLQTYDDIDDVNVLINSAYKTLQSVNHPQIQYSATVADVGGLSLGDTVLIMHGDRDLSYKTRVFEVKYDLLAPDQTELSLGDDLSSNSITSQINNLNAVADTTSIQTQWTINQIGRPGTTYGATAPDSPKVGDIWFKYLPDGGTEIYRWNGDIWELLASPTTADDIANAVTGAVTQAKAHTDEVKQGLSTDIDTAASQAASQASSAEANAKSAATSQFTQAQNALSTAKTDLTKSIASEASARNQAVAAANSQAQTYANQAKADAMSAASSADGVIRTSISSSANSLSATITHNKSSADSGISTAQTTAQAAVDGLKFKVSQTDYNTKTGQLQTDLTTTTQTANQAKTDIVSIKQKDSDQDAKMNTIVSDANGTKQTVSDLQTTQGKQTGDITTLQSRADGFDASVTKINNVVNGLGQTNQLMNTEFAPDFQNWSASNSYITYAGINSSAIINGSNVMNITHGSTSGWDRYSQQVANFVTGGILSASVYARQTTGNWAFTIDSYNSSGTRTVVKQVAVTSTNTLLKIENVTIPSDTVALYFSFWGQTAGTLVFSQPMLVYQSTVGAYVQGNYNNNEALAKVKLTADQASLDLSTYKKDANGLISKAQAGVEANATAITKKVSQSDYDKKTGELSNKLNTTTDTANGTQQALSDYKEYANGNISGVASDLRKLAGEVDLKLSKTDYDDSQSILNTSLAQWKADYDDLTGTVSRLSTTVNDLEQVNQLLNTEFTPDLEGWDTSETSSGVKTPYRQYIYQGSNMLTFDTRNQTGTKYSSIKQTIPFSTSGSNRVVSLSWWSRIAQGSDLYGSTHIRSYDANMAKLTDVAKNWDSSSSMTLQKFENVAIPDGAQFIEVTFAVREGYLAFLAKPMLVYQSTVGTYVPGSYNNNAALAQVKITADGISNFVRDPNGNISSSFQTALSRTSIITDSTLASSIQQQTSSQIMQALTDNNKNIIAMINLDSSGVQISGENIILTGNTTVTNGFKVDQANIANGAIGTAQIGDAAITSAKIVDLDVSKITGNVTNFIQSYWNGVYASTSINANGLSVQSGSTVTTFDSNGAHFANNGQTAHYEFGNWNDVNGNTTSSSGLYLGATGNHNSFIDILAPSGAASVVIAGTEMNYGNNTNIVKEAVNLFYDTNVRSKLLFKGNNINSSTYIEANEVMRTLNFYTDNAKDGNGNWFYFNHKVLSTGTFSSTSLLSKKNVIADYEEDALGEISKTDIVEFEYKNDVGEKHISPIIDDVNDEKDYYIPKTILGQDGEYVDMYSMISMAWKAIKQLNEKIGEK